MERILVLVNGSGPQRATMEFACYVANLTHSKLTGLFIGQVPEKSLEPAGFCRSHSHPELEYVQLKENSEHLEESKLSFQRFCDNHELNLKPDVLEVKKQEDIYLQTRFADLLILSADTEVVTEDGSVPTQFASDVLKHAECPVFIAPLTNKKVNEIVFTYDGSASSVFAIKQFTHLFPQLSELPVTFLEVNRDYSNDIIYKESVTEYLADHYRYVDQLILKGRPEDELFSFFLEKKNLLVVMGSFGRKFFSSVFHRSTATLLLKTTSLPVFISHQQ